MTAAELEQEGYISLREAAEIAGYSPDYLGQLIRKGKLPGRQVYSNVAWMTTREAVLEYVDREGRRGKKDEEKQEVSDRAVVDRVAEALLSERGVSISRLVLISLATFFGYSLLLVIALSAIAFDRSTTALASSSVDTTPLTQLP